MKATGSERAQLMGTAHSILDAMAGYENGRIVEHQYRADLARGIEALEEEMGVRAQDADAVVRLHAEAQERVGQTVYARPQFRVRIAPRTVHHRGQDFPEARSGGLAQSGEEDYPIRSFSRTT